MPLIQAKYATQPGNAGRKDLPMVIAAKATALAAEFLRKEPAVTAVIAEEIPADRWFCAGRSLAELKLASFSLDINITDGTNSKDEKAAFIAHVFDAMRGILGPLHEASYVLVHGIQGDAYGFSGVTQEQRYIEGKLATLRVARRA
jgi:4-oxalocrotonate tautomerase